MSLLVGVAAIAFPNEVAIGWKLVGGTGGVALVWGVIRAWPKKSFSVVLHHPATAITVKVGDLFEEAGHLVIGFSDTFDTALGDLVSPKSVQGQFLSRVFASDGDRLDRELGAALAGIEGKVDASKSEGKTKRYPVGTAISLSGEGRKYVCSAYSSLHPTTFKAQSDIDSLWKALSCIWEELRTTGERQPVAMPIIGSSLARINGVTCEVLVRLILLSYLVHSRTQTISRSLTLVIAEQDLDQINLVEIEAFVKNLHN